MSLECNLSQERVAVVFMLTCMWPCQWSCANFVYQLSGHVMVKLLQVRDGWCLGVSNNVAYAMLCFPAKYIHFPRGVWAHTCGGQLDAAAPVAGRVHRRPPPLSATGWWQLQPGRGCAGLHSVALADSPRRCRQVPRTQWPQRPTRGQKPALRTPLQCGDTLHKTP